MANVAICSGRRVYACSCAVIMASGAAFRLGSEKTNVGIRCLEASGIMRVAKVAGVSVVAGVMVNGYGSVCTSYAISCMGIYSISVLAGCPFSRAVISLSRISPIKRPSLCSGSYGYATEGFHIPSERVSFKGV